MALIIDMEAAIMRHYVNKRRIMNSSLTSDNTREKCKKRLNHCNKVMERFASLDFSTYRFSLKTTKKYGDPLKDFLINWNLHKNNLNTSVDLI